MARIPKTTHTAEPVRKLQRPPVDNIWDAFGAQLDAAPKPAPGWKPKPVNTSRAKYTSPDQLKALERADAVVGTLKRAIVGNTMERLQGISPKDITVDTLMEFPSVRVIKNGVPLHDRNFEIADLRKLLPVELRNVPIGDTFPF